MHGRVRLPDAQAVRGRNHAGRRVIARALFPMRAKPRDRGCGLLRQRGDGQKKCGSGPGPGTPVYARAGEPFTTFACKSKTKGGEKTCHIKSQSCRNWEKLSSSLGTTAER